MGVTTVVIVDPTVSLLDRRWKMIRAMTPGGFEVPVMLSLRSPIQTLETTICPSGQ